MAAIKKDTLPLYWPTIYVSFCILSLLGLTFDYNFNELAGLSLLCSMFLTFLSFIYFRIIPDERMKRVLIALCVAQFMRVLIGQFYNLSFYLAPIVIISTTYYCYYWFKRMDPKFGTVFKQTLIPIMSVEAFFLVTGLYFKDPALSFVVKISTPLLLCIGISCELLINDKKQKKNEWRLTVFNDELENAILNRTKDLISSNEKLQEQVEQLNKSHHENEVLHKKLVANAFKEGFAENAVGVLHNIGNALTGIILTSSDRSQIDSLLSFPNILRQLTETFKKKLESQDLQQFLTEDQKGKNVLSLMRSMSDEVENTTELIAKDLSSISKQLSEVGEIISLQQNYANLKNKVKTTECLKEITEDVINLYRKEIDKCEIELEISMDEESSIKVEKNGLAQAIGNFIQNAKHAIMERKKVDDSFEQGVIKINSYQMDGKVLLEVIDNGIGIEKEVKDNIFKFGFTTKEEGSGFGLHSCYNFIKSNEGKLTVDSSGPKQGAVVQVSFPLLAA